MTKIKVLSGNMHTVPKDLRTILTSSPKMHSMWNTLTPLARNEWICWIESAKKPETRIHRLKRTRSDLLDGKRRPCCWAGCIHR